MYFGGPIVIAILNGKKNTPTRPGGYDQLKKPCAPVQEVSGETVIEANKNSLHLFGGIVGSPDSGGKKDRPYTENKTGSGRFETIKKTVCRYLTLGL